MDASQTWTVGQDAQIATDGRASKPKPATITKVGHKYVTARAWNREWRFDAGTGHSADGRAWTLVAAQ